MDDLISSFFSHSADNEPEYRKKECEVAKLAAKQRFYVENVTKRHNDLMRRISIRQFKVHERTHGREPLATEAMKLEGMLESRHDEVEAQYHDHMKYLDSDTVLGRYGEIEEELRPLQEHFDMLKKQLLLVHCGGRQAV